jgi:hypothetical protein
MKFGFLLLLPIGWLASLAWDRHCDVDGYTLPPPPNYPPVLLSTNHLKG